MKSKTFYLDAKISNAELVLVNKSDISGFKDKRIKALAKKKRLKAEQNKLETYSHLTQVFLLVEVIFWK